MAEFDTKFWVLADAVISAESIPDAWKRLERICKNAREGHIPNSSLFYSGSMTVMPDGHHLQQPLKMTQKMEDRLVIMYHDKVIKQGQLLEAEETLDHVYSMMVGFALAHDLQPEDAKKLAQRLYYGQKEDQQEQERERKRRGR